jgi:DNA polymerase-3 subunit epsilon
MLREIVLDTETTGLDPAQGHRIVEVGCVELINRIPTGAIYHCYFNPERDMPAEAQAVHGLSIEFLCEKGKKFAECADELLEFLGDAKLVIHNAGFDVTFLNAELGKLKKPPIARERLVDTLALARRRHPGAGNRLDDLCARYGIDNSRRTKHGALLDAELLAEVYSELLGGRQAKLGLAEIANARRAVNALAPHPRPEPLPSMLSAEEKAAHRAFIAQLGDSAVWRDYITAGELPSADKS